MVTSPDGPALETGRGLGGHFDLDARDAGGVPFLGPGGADRPPTNQNSVNLFYVLKYLPPLRGGHQPTATGLKPFATKENDDAQV